MHASSLTVAPGFALPDQKGRVRTLPDLLARGRLLLVFHRGMWWPNCRRQFGELAKHVDDFKARGIQVVGLLAQSRDAVRRYIEETGLPFDVLVDERRDVVRAYGVWHRVGIDAWNIARPAAFLIDTDQRILASWIGDNQRQFPAVDEILSGQKPTEPAKPQS